MRAHGRRRNRRLRRRLPVEGILGRRDELELHPGRLLVRTGNEVEAAETIAGERIGRAVADEQGESRGAQIVVLAYAYVDRVHALRRPSSGQVLVEPAIQDPGFADLGLLVLVTNLLDPQHLLLVGDGDVTRLDRNRHKVLRLHLQAILVGGEQAQNPRADEAQDGALEGLGPELGPEVIGGQADDRRVAEVPGGSHRVLADLLADKGLNALPDLDLPGKHEKGDDFARNGMIFGRSGR